MSATPANSTPVPPDAPPVPGPAGVVGRTVRSIRARVVSGLVLALPIALTFWILFWLYATLKQIVLDPLIRGVRAVLRIDDSTGSWLVYNVITPTIAVILVFLTLYFLGLVVRSRVHRAIDWVLLHVPVVTTIYKALSNVFESVGNQLQGGGNSFQRVVLVEFPHPGSRALAFVTNTLRDATTDAPILCVCVLNGVMPPSGFTLYVPAEKVIDIDWSVNQSLQAILSGGITSPAAVHYFQGLRVPPTGPIVGPTGHPIVHPPAAE